LNKISDPSLGNEFTVRSLIDYNHVHTAASIELRMHLVISEIWHWFGLWHRMVIQFYTVVTN